MLKALTDKGITSGKIGIVNVNAATASCVARENGFRSAFRTVICWPPWPRTPT